MKLSIILFVFLVHNQVFCQRNNNMVNDSIVFNESIHKRLYEFEIPETPLSVILIEFLNHDLIGIIKFNSNRTYRSFNGQFESRKRIGIKKTKRLFKKLDKNSFEQLNQPTNEEKCPIYLDADFTFFKIFTPTIRKTIFFDGIYLNSFEKDCESNKKAQNILTVLNNELDFDFQIENFKTTLPPGIYRYINGIEMKKFEIE